MAKPFSEDEMRWESKRAWRDNLIAWILTMILAGAVIASLLLISPAG